MTSSVAEFKTGSACTMDSTDFCRFEADSSLLWSGDFDFSIGGVKSPGGLTKPGSPGAAILALWFSVIPDPAPGVSSGSATGIVMLGLEEGLGGTFGGKAWEKGLGEKPWRNASVGGLVTRMAALAWSWARDHRDGTTGCNVEGIL